jgi:hypothetical protein
MNITIKKQITQKEEAQIPIPCFWKEVSENFLDYRGVIDEETYVRIYKSPNRIAIENGTTKFYETEIAAAYESFDLCTEEEFMAQFEKAYKSISLKPELV